MAMPTESMQRQQRTRAKPELLTRPIEIAARIYRNWSRGNNPRYWEQLVTDSDFLVRLLDAPEIICQSELDW